MPNVAAESRARIVTSPRGTMWYCRMSSDNPISIIPSNAPSAISVCWARFTAGVRKAGTALAMASTPVSAEQPAENALSSNTIPTASTGSAGPRSAPMTDTGSWWRKPPAMTAKMDSTNTMAGPISTLADSAMPIRFSTVSTTSPSSVASSR